MIEHRGTKRYTCPDCGSALYGDGEIPNRRYLDVADQHASMTCDVCDKECCSSCICHPDGEESIFICQECLLLWEQSAAESLSTSKDGE